MAGVLIIIQHIFPCQNAHSNLWEERQRPYKHPSSPITSVIWGPSHCSGDSVYRQFSEVTGEGLRWWNCLCLGTFQCSRVDVDLTLLEQQSIKKPYQANPVQTSRLPLSSVRTGYESALVSVRLYDVVAWANSSWPLEEDRSAAARGEAWSCTGESLGTLWFLSKSGYHLTRPSQDAHKQLRATKNELATFHSTQLQLFRCDICTFTLNDPHACVHDLLCSFIFLNFFSRLCCGHIFCASCLTDFLNHHVQKGKGRLLCPSCWRGIGREPPAPLYLLRDQIAILFQASGLDAKDVFVSASTPLKWDLKPTNRGYPRPFPVSPWADLAFGIRAFYRSFFPSLLLYLCSWSNTFDSFTTSCLFFSFLVPPICRGSFIRLLYGRLIYKFVFIRLTVQ